MSGVPQRAESARSVASISQDEPNPIGGAYRFDWGVSVRLSGRDRVCRRERRRRSASEADKGEAVRTDGEVLRNEPNLLAAIEAPLRAAMEGESAKRG